MTTHYYRSQAVQFLRQFPYIRFRASTTSDNAWVIEGVPQKEKKMAYRKLFDAGCRAIDYPYEYGRLVAFHLEVPHVLVEYFWAEFGSKTSASKHF